VVCPYDLTVPGGVQGQAIGLARAYVGLGQETLLLAPCGSDPGQGGWSCDSSRAGGPDDLRLVSVGRGRSVRVNGSKAPVALFPRAVRAGLVAVRRFDPEVTHIHEPLTPGPSLATLVWGRGPLVGTFHRAGADLAYRVEARALRRLTERLSARVAVSRAALGTICAVLDDDPARYTTLWNGVDLPIAESRTPGRSTPGACQVSREREDSGEIRILFVGRLEQRKGIAVLLEAFASLPPGRVRLTVIGEGGGRDALVATCAENQAITVLGRVSDVVKLEELGRADILVAPSLYGESFGMVVLEALAEGVAVVASDLPGHREVGGDAALYFPAGDSEALGRCLSLLIREPSRRDELGRRGRERAESFTLASLAGRYVEIFASLAADRARPSSSASA